MAVVIDGTNTPTAGGVGYGDGTELAFTSAGTSGQVLTSNGSGAPAFGAVSLTSAVTGTLPVANGGTGATSLTANNVILGNGTSAVQTVAPGTSGNVLTSNGTTWTSAAPSSGMTLVSTQTVSNSGSVSWTGLTNDRYMVVFRGMYADASNRALSVVFGYGATPTYVTSGYYVNSTIGATVTNHNNLAYGVLSYQTAASSASPSAGFIIIDNSSTQASFSGITLNSNTSAVMMLAGRNTTMSGATTAIKLQIESGGGYNIWGTFSLYKLA